MNLPTRHLEGHVKVERKEPSFPTNLLLFENYTAIRAASLIIFLFFCTQFIYSMYNVNFADAEIREMAQVEIEGRGWIKSAWYWLKETLWQDYPESVKLQEKIDSRKNSIIFWPSIRMLMSWTLVWLCFDWERARHFVFAAVTVSLGAIYSVLPVDALPDFIPGAGQIDDLTVNIFGTGLGVASILDYYRRQKMKSHVMSILSEHPESAINIVLEDYDLRLGPAENNNNISS